MAMLYKERPLERDDNEEDFDARYMTVAKQHFN